MGMEELTCVDCFSKMVVSVSLQKSDTQTVVNRFFARILNHYGIILIIISDRDPIF